MRCFYCTELLNFIVSCMEDEMDVESNVHGQDEKCTEFLLWNLNGRDCLKDLDIGGRVML